MRHVGLAWLLWSGAAIFSAVQAQQPVADPSPEQTHQHDRAEATADSVASAATAGLEDPTTSEREHVPPLPPQHQVEAKSGRQMTSMMGMDDSKAFGRVLLDQLEWRNQRAADIATWDATGWYGGDIDRVWMKSEGERRSSQIDVMRFELLWNHVVSRRWSAQTGARLDSGTGPTRKWAAFGVQGLAPYWFEVEATAYLGNSGRTAARFKAEYELLLTQRIILQPELELNLYGKSDPAKAIGKGFSSADVGLRLRYEIRREFAPYLGVSWNRRFGESAELVRAVGERSTELQLLAGLRIWF